MKKFFISCVESRLEEKKNLYALLQIGPFEKNHTLTVANNLRRALLSELDGVAITAIRIDGVLHEYTSLPGVRESVLDILLNIKQVVVASAFKIQAPHFAYLECAGPKIVTASEIIFPSYLKCMNPDQPIATLSPGGSLRIAFFICPGKNYWVQVADATSISPYLRALPKMAFNEETQKFLQFQKFSKANILPIDAVFMPINRVNYTIEIDDEIDTEIQYEHIFFEIWTNGTIHPVEAIQRASQAFIGLFEPFQDLYNNFQTIQPVWKQTFPLKGNKITSQDGTRSFFEGVEFNVPGQVQSQSQSPEKKQKRKEKPDQNQRQNTTSPVLDLDIGNLELSLRPFTCLKRANIHTIKQLINCSKEELLLLKNFGKRSLEEVETSLFKLGYFLRKKSSKAKP